MTRKPTLTLFLTLEAAGIKAPYKSADEAERTLAAWELAFGEVPDEALRQAVGAWMVSDRGHFWPRPSELVRLLPQRRAEVVPSPLDGPGAVWGGLPGPIRIALLDQVGSVACPAHGGAGLEEQVSCEACEWAVGLALDAAAQAHLAQPLRLVQGGRT